MKKLIAILLAAAVVFAFAGCKENKNNNVNKLDKETEELIRTVKGIWKSDDLNVYLSFGDDGWNSFFYDEEKLKLYTLEHPRNEAEVLLYLKDADGVVLLVNNKYVFDTIGTPDTPDASFMFNYSAPNGTAPESIVWEDFGLSVTNTQYWTMDRTVLHRCEDYDSFDVLLSKTLTEIELMPAAKRIDDDTLIEMLMTHPLKLNEFTMTFGEAIENCIRNYEITVLTLTENESEKTVEIEDSLIKQYENKYDLNNCYLVVVAGDLILVPDLPYYTKYQKSVYCIFPFDEKGNHVEDDTIRSTDDFQTSAQQYLFKQMF